jgi:serine/threonine protein phosphatase PrpC
MTSAAASPSWGAATDLGRREMNQDFFIAEPPLFAVADGMGGHRAGDVAARTAVESIAEKLGDGDEALTKAVREANREVFEKARSNPDLKEMGTTITAMVLRDGTAQLVHVGDSRAYLLRAGELKTLTRDHSVVGRLLREGRITQEEADYHPQRSVLERAIGIETDVDVDAHSLDTDPGDRILLCSDGLTNILEDGEIQGILEDESDPQKAAKRLVNEAVRGGANDNVTAVVIAFPGDRGAAPGQAGRRSKARRRAWIAAIGVAILLTLLLGARAVLVAPWWVGSDEGVVVINKGVRSSFAGMSFDRVVERTDLKTGELPENVQNDLEEGIPASSRGDARSIVNNLRKPAGSTPAPTPSPAP